MGWLFFLLFLVVVLRIAVTVKPSLRRPLLIGCYIVLAGILLYMFFLFGGCSGNPTRAYSGNFPGIYILILVAVAALSIGTYYFVVVSKYKKTTYYQITHNGYFKMRGDDGLRGEYQAYTNLSYLEDSGCRFLFNVYLPTNHGETTEADIILFTKLGLVVIESKNYSGWIFGSEQQANWTQTLPQGRRTQKNRFYNPLWQNHA
ncbi:MAG: NERD domain-containing protein, partial [Eggerthellaceae bacterium]|nr:NERD domain-containing protein [Eggerthellaceae bacterium]